MTTMAHDPNHPNETLDEAWAALAYANDIDLSVAHHRPLIEAALLRAVQERVATLRRSSSDCYVTGWNHALAAVLATALAADSEPSTAQPPDEGSDLPRRFLTFAEVPVVAGVATLPSGYTVKTTANIVRYPVCNAVSWADPSEICELEGGHTGGHYSETHAAIWSGPVLADSGCPDFPPGTTLRHHVDGTHSIVPLDE